VKSTANTTNFRTGWRVTNLVKLAGGVIFWSFVVGNTRTKIGLNNLNGTTHLSVVKK